MLSSFSHVQLFVTLFTVSCKGPMSMGFPRQEYWSELPFQSAEDLGPRDRIHVSCITRQILYQWESQKDHIIELINIRFLKKSIKYFTYFEDRTISPLYDILFFLVHFLELLLTLKRLLKMLVVNIFSWNLRQVFALTIRMLI